MLKKSLLTIIMLSVVSFAQASEQPLPFIAKYALGAGAAYGTSVMGFLTYQAYTKGLADLNAGVRQAQLNANDPQTFRNLDYLKSLRRSGRFTVAGGLAGTLFFGCVLLDLLRNH